MSADISTAAQRRRPAVVTIAAAVLGLMALVGLGTAVTTVAAMNGIVDAARKTGVRDRLSSADIDSMVNGLRAGLIGAALLTILISLVLLGLAWGLLRGSRMARIATWVVCGIGVLCSCCNVFGGLGLAGAGGGTFTSSDPQAERMGQAMLDAMPAWFGSTIAGSSGCWVLGYIVTAVLLMLPAANAYFAKSQAGMPQQPPPYPPAQPTLPPTPPSTL